MTITRSSLQPQTEMIISSLLHQYYSMSLDLTLTTYSLTVCVCVFVFLLHSVCLSVSRSIYILLCVCLCVFICVCLSVCAYLCVFVVEASLTVHLTVTHFSSHLVVCVFSVFTTSRHLRVQTVLHTDYCVFSVLHKAPYNTSQ